MQVGGDHYPKDGIQHWDFISYNFGPGYLIGNATKYITRWRKKNGVEDLKKARHYVIKLMEGYQAGHFSNDAEIMVAPHEFSSGNRIPSEEAEIISLIVCGVRQEQLQAALEKLDTMIDRGF